MIMAIKKTEINEARKLICEVGAMLFQRNLTDLAGGNISMRVGDFVLMTPSLAGARKFWQLNPDDLICFDLKGNVVEGSGKVSREVTAHLLLLNNLYPGGKAVIHAHPRNVLVFCATQTPIPPVLECTMKYGEIKVVEYANGGVQSKQLAENVLSGLRGKEELIEKSAAAVIAPWHGIFTVGKDLYSALDTIERIEENAYCILMGKGLLSSTDRLDKHRKALADAIHRTGGSGE
jgi:L-fuculose-phosphate aldolase